MLKFYFALGAVLSASYVVARAEDTATATIPLNSQSPTAGIQETIDSLGGKPGMVTIPPGNYILRIHPRPQRLNSSGHQRSNDPYAAQAARQQAFSGSRQRRPVANARKHVRLPARRVEGNLCEANGQSGIQLWDGASNTVKNNICKNNSQSAFGQFSGISILATNNSLISSNRCFDDQRNETQQHGIEENSNSNGNQILDNDCRNNARDGLALKGKDGQQSGNQK